MAGLYLGKGSTLEGVIFSFTPKTMEPLHHQGHVVWDCRYHIVIVPKYRKKVLYGKVRQRIGELIRELSKRKGIEIVEGRACIDHIHMYISIPPKYSVAQALGYLKGKSAIRIHLERGKKRNPLIQKNFWSRGYFVRTVGIDGEIIKKYIQDQWKKDKYEDGEGLDLHWD